MKTKIIILGTVFGFAAAGGIYFLGSAPDQPSANERLAVLQAQEATVDNATRTDVPPPPVLTQETETDIDQVIANLSKLMREELAGTITDIRVQVSLKDMRNSLALDYPGQGAYMFEQILRNAFPELADRILAAITSMDIYDDWLVENYLQLHDLNPLAKENVIWDKRIAVFGDADARIIWNEEIAQVEQRESNVKTVMGELNTAYDMPMADRVYTMQAVMQDNFGDSAAGLMMGTGNVTTQMVFRLESVQKELASMDAQTRQQTVNEMRLQLGFPEERIAKLEAQDKASNEAWDKGATYMEERTALVASYQGNDLETQLDMLRLKHFDDRHAYSVKQEEAAGMMRYERERVYGLN